MLRAVPFEGALSPLHWLVIGIVALLVLGPDRLPTAARRVGEVMRAARDAGSEELEKLRDAADIKDEP